MSSLFEKMGQIKSLKNGVGVQSLLDEAYRIMGNPIVMFNSQYCLQSYTEVVTDDPLWNEIITHGTFSKESQQFFKSEGFIEDMANAKRVTFMISDKLKYDRIAGKVFNGNNTHVSNLVIVACNKPFESHDEVVLRRSVN